MNQHRVLVSPLLAAPLALTVLLWSSPTALPQKPIPAAPAVGEVAGALVIVGGGFLPDPVRERFLELAGGTRARLVVIPTAAPRPEPPEELKSYPFWTSQKVASVTWLHARTPEQANDPSFVKPLTQATAVWLGGGDQSRLVAAYCGTLVERELRRLVARGGVVGGTSAGAAVMSSLAILGGNPEARLGSGFGLLPGVIVDQHFQNRNRLPRLLGALEKHPTYVGVGIDEGTAVVVKGRTLTVVGADHVSICQPPAKGDKMAKVRRLEAGEELDLARLVQSAFVRNPTEAEEASAAAVNAP